LTAPSLSGALALPASTGPIETIIQAFETAIPIADIKAASQALAEQIKDISSFEQLMDAAVCVLLTAAEDLVLLVCGGIQAVIDVALDLIADAINAFMTALNAVIKVPIISELYKKLVGDDLTVLDLMCLIAALPVTILYKIFFGGSSASPPFTTEDTHLFCATPLPWTWLASVGLGGESAPEITPPTGQAMTTLLKTGPLIAGAFLFLSDVVADILNINAVMEGTPMPPDEAKVIGIINTTLTIIYFGFDQPWVMGVPQTTADRLVIASSLSGMFPVGMDILALIQHQGLARFIELWGPIMVTAMGALELGLGIATAVAMADDSKYNACDQASQVLGGIANYFKFTTLFATGGDEVGAGVALLAASITDLSGDLATPILGYLGDHDD